MAGDEVTMRAKLDSSQFVEGARDAGAASSGLAEELAALREEIAGFSGTAKASIEVNATQAIASLEEYEALLQRIQTGQGKVAKADIATARGLAGSEGPAGQRVVATPSGGAIFRNEAGQAIGGITKSGNVLQQDKAQGQLDRINQKLIESGTQQVDAQQKSTQAAVSQAATAEQAAADAQRLQAEVRAAQEEHAYAERSAADAAVELAAVGESGTAEAKRIQAALDTAAQRTLKAKEAQATAAERSPATAANPSGTEFLRRQAAASAPVQGPQSFEQSAAYRELQAVLQRASQLGTTQRLGRDDLRTLDNYSRGVNGLPQGVITQSPRGSYQGQLEGGGVVGVTGTGRPQAEITAEKDYEAGLQSLADETRRLADARRQEAQFDAATRGATRGRPGGDIGSFNDPHAGGTFSDYYASQRRDIAAGQVAGGTAREAGGYTFGQDLSGQLSVTETRTGRLVTSFQELNRASTALTSSLQKEAEAQEKINAQTEKTPLGEFYHGVFGAGGRKRRGGAQPVDEENPLNGLFETAGVVAKYEVLGRGLQLIVGGAVDAVKSLASLDEAVAGFNAQLGQGNEVSTGYVQSLENIASAAGQDVVGAIQSAQRGAAAFGTPGDANSQKAAGLETAQATSTNALVTGQDAKGSTDDLIAIATSYGKTADSLSEITNAVAVAKETFGANAKDIQDGLAGIADVGATSGFSLQQLAQVVGDVAAKTGESGSTIATNLTRIFTTLKTPATSATLSQQLGIDLTGSVKDKIEEIAAAYPKLTKSQQDSLAATVGGAKGLRDLLPLLRDQPQLQAAYSKALTDTGAGQREANAQLNSLAGRFRAFGALIKQLGLDIAQTGILTPLLAIFGAIEPIIKVLDRLIQGFDRLPGPIREGAAALLEAVVALNAFKAAQAAGLVSGTGALGRGVRQVGTSVFGNPFRDRSAAGAASNATAQAGLAEVKAAEANLVAVMRQGTVAIGKASEELAAAVEANVGVEEAEAAKEAAMASAANAQLVAIGKVTAAEDAAAAAIGEAAAARKATEAEVDVSARSLSASLQRAAFAAADFAAKPFLPTGAGYEGKLSQGAFGSAARGSISEDIAYGGGLLRGKARGVFGADAAAAESGVLYNAERGLLRPGAALSRLGLGQNAATLGAAGLGTTALGVGAVAYGSYKLYEQGNAERKAIGQADSATQLNAGSSADTLQAKADALNKAADTVANASKGFFGTVGGALGEVFGGQDRGIEKGAARSQAAALAATSQKLGDVTQQNYGAFDLSATDGVANGLKTLALNGLTAQQQIDALNKALDSTAPVAAGATKRLGDSTAVATATLGIGTDINQNIQDYADTDRSAIGAFFSRHGAAPTRDAGKQLGKLDQTQFTTGIQADAAGYLNQDGLSSGQAITPDSIKLLTSQLQNSVRQRLKDQGIEFSKLPKAVQDQLMLSAKGGAEEALNAVDGARPQVITQANVQAIIDAEPGLAQKAASDLSTNISIGVPGADNGSGDSADVQGARLALADSKATEKKLIASGKANQQQLAQYEQEQNALKLNLQNAILSQDQAYGQLAQASLGSFDPAGVIQAQINETNKEIGDAGKDKAKLAQLNAQLKQQQAQLAQQNVTDRSTIHDASLDPRDLTGVAQHQLDNDVRQRNLVRRDPHSSKAERDAAERKVLNDAINLRQVVQEQAATSADAAVAVGDQVGLAFQQAADLYAKAATDLKGSPQRAADLKAAAEQLVTAQGLQVEQNTAIRQSAIDPRNVAALDASQITGDVNKRNALAPGDTTGRAQAQIQINQDIEKQREDQVAQANALRLAAIDPRNLVQAAQVALTNANASLRAALPGTAAYAQAQADVRDKTLALATAQEDAAHSAVEANLGPNQAVGKAAEDLRHAAATMALFKAGQDGWNTAHQQYLDAQQAYADAVNADALATDKARTNPQDAVGQAQDALKDVNRRIRSYVGPKTGPDSAGYQNLLAERAADQLAERQAQAARATARDESRVDPRDTVGEAQAALRGAQRTLATDHRGTTQYYTDLKALQQAKLALAQAELQLSNDTLEAGIDSRNLTGEAAAKVTEAIARLATDKAGTDQYEQDQKSLADARLAAAQAQTDVVNAQIAASVIPGDQVGAAQAAIQEALNNLKNDLPGQAKYYQDQQALRQAQFDLASAQEAYSNTLTLLGTDTTNPVDVSIAAVKAAQQKLSDDQRLGAAPSTIASDQLSLTQSQNAEQKTAFEQQLSDAQTNYQLHRISGAAYIQYLRAQQANLKATGLGTRQLLDEYNEVSQTLLSANQQLTGQFNIGNIALPTVYQERRLAGQNGIDIKPTLDTTGSTAFGADTSPLAQAAQTQLNPLVQAVNSISTQSAVDQLIQLQTVLDALGGGATPASSANPAGSSLGGVSTSSVAHVTINGADLVQVKSLLGSLLGSTAISSSGTTATIRKVS